MSAARFATFGLSPATRAGDVLPNGDHQRHREFVDFVVDGRPLPFRIPDLDAVSALACDVPPALFTAQVRALLLETPAPLPGGRRVLYGCPDCEDPACGAVTAVIERDADDYVWRDFARQTAEHAGLALDGHPGVGPFRFRGPEYRTALTALLGAGPARTRRRVLLIGARVGILAGLAAALRGIGVGADLTRDIDGVDPDELRGYGAVALGPGTPEDRRARVRRELERAGSDAARVDGLAPVVPLLVAQIAQALDRRPPPQRRLTGLAAAGGEAGVELACASRVRVTAYRLDRLNRLRVHELFDGVLEPGRHRIALHPKAARGESFVVARASGSVLAAAVTR